NDEIEKHSLERSSIYRKCRLEEIRLPLLKGNLKNIPMDEVRKTSTNAMDIDVDDNNFQIKRGQDYGIEVDCEDLKEEDREDGSPEALKAIDDDIAKATAEIERMAPNMKAVNQ
ncbi:hypothetical protein FISHEDRAFT_51957, partial [Fistulina hepatica ATCC 64428]